MCLDQRSFKCKIGEHFSNLLFIGTIYQILSSIAPHGRNIPLLGMYLSRLGSHVLLSFLWMNFQNRPVKYICYHIKIN